MTISLQLGAGVVERHAVVGGDPRGEARRRPARGSAAGAALRRRSAGTRCPAGSRGRRRPASCGPNESVTPASNQQIIPALAPQSTMPASQASRSSASMPCARQIASMFAVLPPLTQIASCARMRSRRSSGGHGNVQRWELGAIAEPLVEADDRIRRFADRGRDEEEPRPGLPGQAEHVLVEPPVCSAVSPPPPRPTMCRSIATTRVARAAVLARLLQSRHGVAVAAAGRRPLLRDLPARRAAGLVRRRASAVHAAGAARERAAERRPSPTSRRSHAGTRRPSRRTRSRSRRRACCSRT